MSRHARRRAFGAGYRLLVMALFGLALALAGGASRADEIQQVLVRSAAILAIGASLWPLDFTALRRLAHVVAAVAAAYLLLLLQLIPLPPAVWAALPGHGVYADIAQAAGAVVWRPLSLTPDLTLNALAALLPATAAALAALHLDFRGRVQLTCAIVILALLSGLLGLAQLAAGGLRLYRETSQDSAVGLFANRNHQAALMACALPLTGAIAGLRLRDSAGRPWIIGVAVAVSAFLLLALVSTGSRMGLVLGVVGGIGALWAYRSAGLRLWPARAAGRLAVAGGATALLAMTGLAAVARGAALGRLAAADLAGETRVAMLNPLLSTAKAFMPLGAGFGAFEDVYRRFEPNALLSTIYMNQAHNEPLQLAIEGGVPALVLLAIFARWWIRSTWRAVSPEQGARRRAMGVAAAMVTVILMLSSLVDYPLRTPLLSALFAIACVELLAGATRERRPDPGGEV